MLLRSSISNTKKFFQKTLQNFKSFFSSGYHRLPKTPPHNYSAPMDMDLDMHNHASCKEKEGYYGNPVQKMKDKQMEKRVEYGINGNKNKEGREQDSASVREKRNGVVERKLRELETLDMGNVDYLLDIEEVLHYYSRLTCPAYLEMVDTFFMQIYSDFFLPISKLD